MHDSPRMRRLRNDLIALERLASESSVFRFKAHGNPPTQYDVAFHGKSLYRDANKSNKVKTHDTHRVQIKLGSSYPRTIPEIRWLTPIYHPNISEIGLVCLGGYGTHWVPSLQLDELCVMLWDMLRFHNYEVRSPYNREAAIWFAGQTAFVFPTDNRPLRDLRAALGRVDTPEHPPKSLENGRETARSTAAASARALAASANRVREFIGKRYSRAFGEVVHSAADSPPNAAVAPPRSSSLLDLVAAEIEPGQSTVEARPVLTPALPLRQVDETAADFVILEDATPRAALERPRPFGPPADEIRFIE